MKTKTICPPLTQDEILNLRGQPMAKCIDPIHNDSLPVEEWVYYKKNSHTYVQESYLFKNGRLVSWTTKPI